MDIELKNYNVLHNCFQIPKLWTSTNEMALYIQDGLSKLPVPSIADKEEYDAWLNGQATTHIFLLQYRTFLMDSMDKLISELNCKESGLKVEYSDPTDPQDQVQMHRQSLKDVYSTFYYRHISVEYDNSKRATAYIYCTIFTSDKGKELGVGILPLESINVNKFTEGASETDSDGIYWFKESVCSSDKIESKIKEFRDILKASCAK